MSTPSIAALTVVAFVAGYLLACGCCALIRTHRTRPNHRKHQ